MLGRLPSYKGLLLHSGFLRLQGTQPEKGHAEPVQGGGFWSDHIDQNALEPKTCYDFIVRGTAKPSWNQNCALTESHGVLLHKTYRKSILVGVLLVNIFIFINMFIYTCIYMLYIFLLFHTNKKCAIFTSPDHASVTTPQSPSFKNIQKAKQDWINQVTMEPNF